MVCHVVRFKDLTISGILSREQTWRRVRKRWDSWVFGDVPHILLHAAHKLLKNLLVFAVLLKRLLEHSLNASFPVKLSNPWPGLRLFEALAVLHALL